MRCKYDVVTRIALVKRTFFKRREILMLNIDLKIRELLLKAYVCVYGVRAGSQRTGLDAFEM